MRELTDSKLNLNWGMKRKSLSNKAGLSCTSPQKGTENEVWLGSVTIAFWIGLSETKTWILEQICQDALESINQRVGEDKHEFRLMDKQIPVVEEKGCSEKSGDLLTLES